MKNFIENTFTKRNMVIMLLVTSAGLSAANKFAPEKLNLKQNAIKTVQSVTNTTDIKNSKTDIELKKMGAFELSR